MPILGIWASSRPSVAADTGAMFPLQVITVGSAGAASIEFTNIPSTYTHLQIRGLGRSSGAGSVDFAKMQFNNDTTSNYATHYLYGTGASALATAFSSSAYIYQDFYAGAAANASVFSGFVIDILDYRSTNKNKTVRMLSGWDNNGATNNGNIALQSGLWFKTPEAITSIKLTMNNGSFVQYSSFALYGVKSA